MGEGKRGGGGGSPLGGGLRRAPEPTASRQARGSPQDGAARSTPRRHLRRELASPILSRERRGDQAEPVRELERRDTHGVAARAQPLDELRVVVLGAELRGAHEHRRLGRRRRGGRRRGRRRREQRLELGVVRLRLGREHEERALVATRQPQLRAQVVGLQPALCVVAEELKRHRVRQRQRAVPQRAQQHAPAREAEAQPTRLRLALEGRLDGDHTRRAEIHHVVHAASGLFKLDDLVQARHAARARDEILDGRRPVAGQVLGPRIKVKGAHVGPWLALVEDSPAAGQQRRLVGVLISGSGALQLGRQPMHVRQLGRAERFASVLGAAGCEQSQKLGLRSRRR